MNARITSEPNLPDHVAEIERGAVALCEQTRAELDAQRWALVPRLRGFGRKRCVVVEVRRIVSPTERRANALIPVATWDVRGGVWLSAATGPVSCESLEQFRERLAALIVSKRLYLPPAQKRSKKRPAARMAEGPTGGLPRVRSRKYLLDE